MKKRKGKLPFNETTTAVLPIFYCELHEILWLMKYSSSGWTAQMPQVFCGSTKQSITEKLGITTPRQGNSFQTKRHFLHFPICDL